MRAELAVVEEFFTGLADNRPSSRFMARRRRALTYYSAGRGLHATAQPAEALRWFAKAFLTFPLIPRLYAAIALSALKLISRSRPKSAPFA